MAEFAFVAAPLTKMKANAEAVSRLCTMMLSGTVVPPSLLEQAIADLRHAYGEWVEELANPSERMEIEFDDGPTAA